MRRVNINAAPVNRNYRTGEPLQSNVITFNRSEWIRRIFDEHGSDISNDQVMDILQSQVGKNTPPCHPSLIQKVRRKLYATPVK